MGVPAGQDTKYDKTKKRTVFVDPSEHKNKNAGTRYFKDLIDENIVCAFGNTSIYLGDITDRVKRTNMTDDESMATTLYRLKETRNHLAKSQCRLRPYFAKVLRDGDNNTDILTQIGSTYKSTQQYQQPQQQTPGHVTIEARKLDQLYKFIEELKQENDTLRKLLQERQTIQYEPYKY